MKYRIREDNSISFFDAYEIQELERMIAEDRAEYLARGGKFLDDEEPENKE